jgi:hypothetical protein
VVTCRTLGGPKFGGDLAVSESAGYEECNVLLAAGKLAHRFFGRWFV